MKKVFLDTNVILDLLAQRTPFYEGIARIATLADHKKLLLFASPISFTTVHYVLSKFEPTESVLTKMRKFAVICKVSEATQETIDKSLISQFNDFEDAVQYHCAMQSGCDIIITRNGSDFKKAEIPVMTADEFIISTKQH